MERTNRIKSWFFERVTHLINSGQSFKKKRKRNTNVRNEDDILTYHTDIKEML